MSFLRTILLFAMAMACTTTAAAESINVSVVLRDFIVSSSIFLFDARIILSLLSDMGRYQTLFVRQTSEN